MRLYKSHEKELKLNLSLNIKGFYVKVKCSFCSVHNEPNWLHCCLNYIWRIYWASLIETLNWRIAVVQVSGIEAKLISLKIELKLKGSNNLIFPVLEDIEILALHAFWSKPRFKTVQVLPRLWFGTKITKIHTFGSKYFMILIAVQHL